MGLGKGRNIEHYRAATATLRSYSSERHRAATEERSNLTAVAWLLVEGLDPSLPDRDGWTPLHWAAKCGGAESIENLEGAGAWKTNTAFGCSVERPTPIPGNVASLEADARSLGGQVSPGAYHVRACCRGCNLVSRFLNALIVVCTDKCRKYADQSRDARLAEILGI